MLVTVLFTGVLLAFLITNSAPVRADHSAEHCEEVFGASGADYENCISNLGSSTETGDVGSNGMPITSGTECTGNSANCCNGVVTTVAVDCPSSTNPILGYLGGIMNFLAAGVGVVVVAMVTLAGVQYLTSRGDPQRVGAAKSRLINALIGLISFIFLYAFLQWLIPGGLFGGGSGPPDCTGGGPC